MPTQHINPLDISSLPVKKTIIGGAHQTVQLGRGLYRVITPHDIWLTKNAGPVQRFLTFNAGVHALSGAGGDLSALVQNNALDFGTGSFAIEIWARNIGITDEFIFGMGDSANALVHCKTDREGGSNGTLEMQMIVDTNDNVSLVNTNQIDVIVDDYNPDIWTQLFYVVDRDAEIVYFYANRQLQAQFAFTDTAGTVNMSGVTSSGRIAIGGASSAGPVWGGDIAALRIYNGRIELSHVQTSFDAGPGYIDPAGFQPAAYLALNEFEAWPTAGQAQLINVGGESIYQFDTSVGFTLPGDVQTVAGNTPASIALHGHVQANEVTMIDNGNGEGLINFITRPGASGVIEFARS